MSKSTIFDTLVTDAMRRAFAAADQVTAKYTNHGEPPHLGAPVEFPLGPYFFFEIAVSDDGEIDDRDPEALPNIQVTCSALHTAGEQVTEFYPMTNPRKTYEAEFENLVDLVKRKQESNAGPDTKVA